MAVDRIIYKILDSVMLHDTIRPSILNNVNIIMCELGFAEFDVNNYEELEFALRESIDNYV